MAVKNVIIRSVHLERRPKVTASKEKAGDSKVTLEMAQELFRNLFSDRLDKTEEKLLQDAAGQILAEPVYAMVTQPPFARSAMDGYAVRSCDIKGADRKHPVSLKVAACVYAGQKMEQKLAEGEAIRIMTGAMIPDGADCVVKQEDTDHERFVDAAGVVYAGEEKKVEIYHAAIAGENYCPEGEDFLKGEKLAEAGEKIDAYMLAAAAAAGVSQLKVYKKICAAVITTGDELQGTGTTLEPGRIYDANGIWLCARLKEMNCDVVRHCITGDDCDRIVEEIESVLHKADLIITTGGVSVGDKDYLPEVIKKMNGNILFHGIKIKPGMPTMMSVVKDTPVLSLSGNPFAMTALFEVLVGSLLTSLAGCAYAQKRIVLPLMNSFVKTGGVKRIVKGRTDGKKVFFSCIQRNGQLKNGIGSNCLMIFPEEEKEYQEGECVTVIQI